MVAAQRLKELRLKHDYTQEYLAVTLDISQKSYSNLEKGDKRITLQLVSKIAACYEMEVTELVVKLVSVNSSFIDQIKKDQPDKSEMEVHYGINDSLQMQLIKSLNARIEDLNRIIKLKDDQIASLQHSDI